MSWKIQNQKDGRVVVILEGEIGIHSASDFYNAILPLASNGGSVGVNASSAVSLHTSIMQILFSFSKAVPEFGIISDASPGFIASEARVGIQLPRTEQNGNVTLLKKNKTSKKKPKGA